ncbi:MAG: AAA family ATPase, partial [Thermoleophilaceae bacterium]
VDPEELRGRLHVAANARVRLDDLGWQKELVQLGSELRPRLFCFDPLARFKQAARDENDQAQMAVLVEFLRDLRDATGAGVAFVHHTGHNGEHMRGASDLESVWETRLAWKRDGQSPEVTIESEHREAEASGPLVYRIHWDGETRTMRFDLVEDDVTARVRAYLAEHPDASANEVDENVEGNRTAILTAVKSAKSEGGSERREPPGTTSSEPPLAGGSEEGGTPRRGAPPGTTADGPVPASGNLTLEDELQRDGAA